MKQFSFPPCWPGPHGSGQQQTERPGPGTTGLPAASSQLALLGALHSLTSGFFMWHCQLLRSALSK